MYKYQIKTLIIAATAWQILLLTLPAASAANSTPWSLETGLGFDSNVYRSNDSSYIDYATAGNPVVNPDVQSGFYIPLKVNVHITDEKESSARLNTDYRLIAEKYLDSALSNADSYFHRLTAGRIFSDKTEASPDGGVLHGEFTLDLRRQTYVDRDDGLDKTTTGGNDVANRYNYIAYGVDLVYDNRIQSWPYTINGGYKIYDYSDPTAMSQLDQDRFNLAIASEYTINNTTKFKYGYEYSTRSYADRHAIGSNGVTTTANPLREYQYHSIDLSLRHRISASWISYADYSYTQRSDDYVGYNDYGFNEIKWRNIYKTPNSRTRIVLSYYEIDYPNAYAFENSTQANKTADRLRLLVNSEFTLNTQRWWAEVEVTDKNTNDLRYQYDRYQISAGIILDF